MNTQFWSLYKPIQPNIDYQGTEVAYCERSASPLLGNQIYCYWELKSLAPLDSAFHYRVVADGCVDVFFDLRSPAEVYAMGFCDAYTKFELEDSFHFVGIRFLPAGFKSLFGVDVYGLSNQSTPLQNVEPTLAKHISLNYDYSYNFEEICLNLDMHFIKQKDAKNLRFDNRLYESIEIILNKRGVVQTEKDLNTGISPRQLRRLFKQYVGTTPKTFSKVVRFQSILNAKPSSDLIQKNKSFLEAYYDQSHFIKDFKNFYGSTPGEIK